MTGTHIRKFFKDHPAITITVFCKEAKIGLNTLNDILKGAEPRQTTINKMLPVMIKYGYDG